MCQQYSVFQVIWLISLALSRLGSAGEQINNAAVLAISNGRAATEGQVPWQIALKVLMDGEDDLYDTICGGAIIGENKILSAAHCFAESSGFCRSLFAIPPTYKKLDKMYAVAGGLRTRARYTPNNVTTEQWRRMIQSRVPVGFRFPRKDIAVAVTVEPFVFNDNVAPVPYSKKAVDYGVEQCIVSGYGKISYTVRSDTLMITKLTLISAKMCSIIHEQDMDKFICTRSTYADVGPGDSGGPLVCFGTADAPEHDGGVLVGIVSGTRDNCGTFFTRVSSYKQFIENRSFLKTSATNFWIAFVLIHFTRLMSSLLFYSAPWNCNLRKCCT